MNERRYHEVWSRRVEGRWVTVIWEVRRTYKHKFYVLNIYKPGEAHKLNTQPPWYESVAEARGDIQARVIEHSLDVR